MTDQWSVRREITAADLEDLLDVEVNGGAWGAGESAREADGVPAKGTREASDNDIDQGLDLRAVQEEIMEADVENLLEVEVDGDAWGAGESAREADEVPAKGTRETSDNDIDQGLDLQAGQEEIMEAEMENLLGVEANDSAWWPGESVGEAGKLLGKSSGMASDNDVDQSSDQPEMALGKEPSVLVCMRRLRKIAVCLPIMVCGVSFCVVVDTGAEVSVMSEPVLNSIVEQQRPILTAASIGLVAADSSTNLKARGVANFEIQHFQPRPCRKRPLEDGGTCVGPGC